MLAYRLRHRIALQRKQEVQDPTTLEMTTTWVTATLGDGTQLSSVPAEVLTGPGKEFIAAQGERPQGMARINMRWIPVTPDMLTCWRVLWDGRTFNIRSAETDVTGRREWRLICENGVNDG